ncbi:MAG: DUF3536 domain-containing protein, partial [Chlamydiota bacterium]|nr:DUF3536 domain-containing protein [Chlamydiota bacterium]
RESLNWLRDKLNELYHRKASMFLSDPLSSRRSYIDIILDRSEKNIKRFFKRHAKNNLQLPEITQCLKLLESQRYAQLMFTSCGWFFDDVSGLESKQILKYAARAIELANEFGVSLEEGFVKKLDLIPSNVSHYGTGSNVYKEICTLRTDALKQAAQYAFILMACDGTAPDMRYGCHFQVLNQFQHLNQDSIHRLGELHIQSNLTLEEWVELYYLRFSEDGEMISFVKERQGDEEFHRYANQLKADTSIEKFFPESFEIEDLVIDDRKRIYGWSLERKSV